MLQKRKCRCKELIAECRNVKAMKDIQTAFIRETGVSSWEEAKEKFPGFVTAEALDEFRCCSFKSGSTPVRFAATVIISMTYIQFKQALSTK